MISFQAYSQVGINTVNPNSSSALDIVSSDKGVLIPRMTTSQMNSIENPAQSLLVYDTTTGQIMQNVGTTSEKKWISLSLKDPRRSFFYMPSVSIDASKAVTGQTLDLYKEYERQFTGADQSTFKASDGAPAKISYFPSATDLDYYITYYDKTVIKVVSLDSNGVLKYEILKESDYDSFMNVVFNVK